MTVELKVAPTPLEAGDAAVVNRGGNPAAVVLGTAAVEDATAFAAAVHTHLLAQITDAGTAAAADVGDFASAAQGAAADTAVQPGDLVDASRVIWVDPAGDDAASGKLPTAPKQTITAALASAVPGDCIRIRAGLYIEPAPMIVPRDVSLFGDGLRVTEIRPAAGTETEHLFLVDSGAYFWGITFARHQAGSFAVAFNGAADNTGIGATGPGAFILKSPYIQNCSSYTAAENGGTAGSVSEGATGGGMIVDGDACAPNSPIRSMVVDSYTQVNLDGPGCLVTNDGYAQLVSFFGTFCSYHVKAKNGGQVNLSNSTTNFGTLGLVADGRSTTPLFTGTAAAAADGANQIDVTALGANRIGLSSKPALGQVFDVDGVQRTVTGSTPITDGFTVTFFPALTAPFAGGAVEFFNRSQIMTGGQNMEYVGAGTNYLALPQNGGVPIQANEVVELNGGRVFFSTTDHIGTFRVGNQFSVDGVTGEVTINTDSFNISGLNQIGPFSRDGGQTTVGVQLREVSNNSGLIASTGAADGNTVPTQAAVVAYVAATSVPVTRTVTAGAGLTGGGDLSGDISLDLADTAVTAGGYGSASAVATFTVDAQGRLTAAEDVPIEIAAGAVTGLAAVATSGSYGDLTGLPTLGTAAAEDVGTGAGNVVQLDGSGRLPAVDGSQLTNIEAAAGVGDVVGPAASTDGALAQFDGTSGKLLQDGPAVPAGDLVGTTAEQTLTGKTLGNYTESVFTVTDGASVDLDPNDGPIQLWTLGDNRTPGQANWGEGQSITLMIDDGADRTIDWGTLAVIWKTDGGTAPTLSTTQLTTVVLWKAGTTIYGARVGDA